MIPGTPVINIGETFTRDSTFYKDAKGNFQEKQCRIELHFFGLDSKAQKAGHIMIDIGSLVGRQHEVLLLPFKGQTVTKNALLRLTATIFEDDPRMNDNMKRDRKQTVM